MIKSAAAIAAGSLSLLISYTALASDVPALQGKSPEEHTRITALIEDAKKEGALSYYDAVVAAETSDELAAVFKKTYGLPSSFEVRFTQLSTGNLVTRLEQELGANRVTVDVASLASPSWVFERMAKGDITEYASPEYAAYEPAYKLGFAVKNFFAPNGGYLFLPMWNADNLDFKGKSYKDVIKAVPEGRITIGDASNSTAYLATYMGQREKLDRSFFESLAQMKPSFLVRAEQIAARLVSGQDLMTYSGQPAQALRYNKKGINLKFIFPEEGVVIMPQCQFIVRGAPHPAAARLWVDFILSETGQTLLAQREAMVSSRSGFKTPNPEYAPSLEQLKIIPIDWRSVTTTDVQKARQDWSGIFQK